MAESSSRRLSLQLPWTTLLKVLAAVAIFFLWRELVWVVLLAVLALVIAAGLLPITDRLERHGWPRWTAAVAVVFTIVGTVVVFLVLTWSQLSEQSASLGSQLRDVERAIVERAPAPIVELLKSAGGNGGASLGPFVMRVGVGVLSAVAAFVLAWILVLYLLIEREQTYAWVRGFVPARLRGRFDQTATEARDVAGAFVIGNLITSACAGLYFFVWLTVLGVPGALLLALLAFVFDFIPVLGFYLSCLPAMAMAATQSGTLALAMIPIYLSYDVIENYLLAPRVYGQRLRLSKLAVLLAFAVGAQLAGVIGALLALPVAAIYPTIEKLWLRGAFGDAVVEAHRETWPRASGRQ
jgi:predicted PurR-regulated permease PerM